MKHYETLFIVKPTLTAEEITAKIEAIHNIIATNGGEIVAKDDWGVKRLGYTIQKNQRGHFHLIYFKAPTPLIAELERNYRINEDIIRFITVKFENRKEVNAWQRMVDKALHKTQAESAKTEPAPAKEETPKEAAAQPEKAAEAAPESTPAPEAPAETQEA